jgi:hypothetical protein
MLPKSVPCAFSLLIFRQFPHLFSDGMEGCQRLLYNSLLQRCDAASLPRRLKTIESYPTEVVRLVQEEAKWQQVKCKNALIAITIEKIDLCSGIPPTVCDAKTVFLQNRDGYPIIAVRPLPLPAEHVGKCSLGTGELYDRTGKKLATLDRRRQLKLFMLLANSVRENHLVTYDEMHYAFGTDHSSPNGGFAKAKQSLQKQLDLLCWELRAVRSVGYGLHRKLS